jgi:hypothetical protein
MTFFVRNSNYLLTIVSLVDRKRFRLEMLYGRRIFKNHEHRKESSFFQIPPIKKPMLRISSTYLQLRIGLLVEDY